MNSPIDISSFDAIEASIGTELGCSEWIAITQDKIDEFGRNTCDIDAMHMDPDWASEHSPYGSTIAYGFQTLAMSTTLMSQIVPRGSSEAYKINYGFDKVRLLAPVRCGQKIRGRATLMDVRKRDAHSHIVKVQMFIDVSDEEKPAVVAEWLFLVANASKDSRRPDMQAAG